MLYVICCMLCILGCWCHLGGVLGGHWGHLGRLWGYLGLCRGHLGTTLGGLGRYLGTPWGLGFMVWGFGNSTHTLLKCKNRYRLTPVQRKRSHEKTKMFSSIETTYLRNMPSSLSHYTCAANSLSGHAADRKKVITDIQNH